MSKNEVRAKSQKKHTEKDVWNTNISNGSNGGFLDPVSGPSSSKSAKESTGGRSSETGIAKVYGSSPFTANLIQEASKLIGVDYRYGGTSPSRGFDCSGFTSYVFKKIDIVIPRTSTDQSRTGKRKNFKDALVGDLVFFGTGNRVTHVGIVVARTSKSMEVIHSTSSSGVRKDEIFGSEYWSSRALWAVDFSSLE